VAEFPHRFTSSFDSASSSEIERTLSSELLGCAVIIAAAYELGCATLYSEDFSHGQDYDGVRVVNPFLRSV